MKKRKPCPVKGCKNKVPKWYKHCSTHSSRLRKYGTTDSPIVARRKLLNEGKWFCSKCRTVKDRQLFGNDSYKRYGISSWCLDCARQKSLRRYYNDFDKHNDSQLRSKYNISLADYHKMRLKQKNKCSICKRKPKYKLEVDHCHTTGVVRGLLCQKCNVGLGHFNDNIIYLKSAIDYLNKGKHTSATCT